MEPNFAFKLSGNRCGDEVGGHRFVPESLWRADSNRLGTGNASSREALNHFDLYIDTESNNDDNKKINE